MTESELNIENKEIIEKLKTINTEELIKVIFEKEKERYFVAHRQYPNDQFIE